MLSVLGFIKNFGFKPIITLFIVSGCNNNQQSNLMKQNNTFEISYELNAPINQVFEMWVNLELFARWLGPDGANMKFLTNNIKEGETAFWTMTTQDGLTKFGQISYKTIKPNELLVYLQNFCDEHGNFTKAPFSATYPDYLLTTVTFSETETKTKIFVRWEIFGDASPKEIETFNALKENMTVGWTESFIKLEHLLNEAR